MVSSAIGDEISDKLSKIKLNGFMSMSQKDKPQLYYNGYFYRTHSVPKNGKVSWRCIVATCKAKCTTFGSNIGQFQFIFQNFFINILYQDHFINIDIKAKI